MLVVDAFGIKHKVARANGLKESWRAGAVKRHLKSFGSSLAEECNLTIHCGHNVIWTNCQSAIWRRPT